MRLFSFAPGRTRTSAASVRAAGWSNHALSYSGKRLLRVVAAGLFALPAFGSFPNGYNYCKTLTISHTMVSGANDLANFPLTVILTDAALKTTANGGQVNNSSGYDIGFGPDCSGSGTMLKWEMESYTPATGSIVAYVLRPALSHTADDTIGMYYSGAFSSFQSTASAVWVNYVGVWHLGEASNAQAMDSSGNGMNSTTSVTTQVAGKLGLGKSFTKASSQSLIFPRINTQADYTISAWINISAADYGIVMDGRGGVANGPVVYTIKTSGKVANFFNPPGLEADSTAVAADSTWHYVVGTRSGTTLSIYLDGNAPVSITVPTYASWGADLRIAEDFSGGFYSQLNDETRISTVARSSDWILTEYRNQSAPATYLSLGVQQSSTSAKVRHRAFGGE